MNAVEATTWQSYEEVARYLIDQMADRFGLDRIEGKQSLLGQSGTKWEIDGEGCRAEDGAVVVIECRRLTTSVKQEAVAAIAYRIMDLGASGGILVTPIGAQSGAQIVAADENIQVVQLDAGATTTDYVLKFLDEVSIGRSPRLNVGPRFSAEAKANPGTSP